jgi:hypothetical protein
MSKVQLEVFDPSGITETTGVHATRLNSLNGKTIGELSNAGWEYPRTFTLIRKLLQDRFPDIKIIPYTEFPIGTGVGKVDVEGIEDLVKEKGCDGVIIGNAA